MLAALAAGTPGAWLYFGDRALGHYRGALLDEWRPQFAFYVAPDAAGLPAREGTAALVANPHLPTGLRRALLAGRAPSLSTSAGAAI
jgi:hypothetical protein